MSVKVTDVDKGYSKMLKLLTAGKKPVVKVGIFGSKASETHKGTEISNGEIAMIHEFGLGNVPERSFIRGWVDENEDKVASFLQTQCEKAVEEKAPNFDVVLERLGLYCVAGMQKRMSDGIPPPLKSRSGTPLINTGQLRSSISYTVVDERGK